MSVKFLESKFFKISLKTISILVITISVLGILLAGYLFLPPATVAPSTSFKASQSYDEAKTRLAKLQTLDDDSIRSECKTTLLDHGNTTSKVFVLYHGFTSCPKQYDQFAQILYDKGYNVLIPRLKYHGYFDLTTRDQAKITPTDFMDLTQESVGIATGLGQKVEVVGLSGGGVMALWAGLNLPNIDQVVAISPIIQPLFFKDYPQNVVTQGLRALPDNYIFWDEKLKEKAEFAPYAYKGFSTKALGQLMTLGYNVKQQSKQITKHQTKFVLISSGSIPRRLRRSFPYASLKLV